MKAISILDTNVVSELMRPSPFEIVANWVDRQISTGLYISTITEAELRYGTELLPEGRRKNGLLSTMEAMFREEFAGRILPFDRAAARAYAVIAATRRAAGLSVKHSDCQIAAIAYSVGASVVTRNVRDFEGCGVDVINPWSSG